MRTAIIAGDLLALTGITSPALVVAHVLPDVVLFATAISSSLGGAWYAVLLWNHFFGKKKIPIDEA